VRRQRTCISFAVVLLLWQLLAGSFAHAEPMTGMDCVHGQASQGEAPHGHASTGQPDHGHVSPAGHGDSCGSSVCQCPCGHTPALRVDLPPADKVAPPTERPASAVESRHADPIEEHFRPPT
jgi:hypothetical protein